MSTIAPAIPRYLTGDRGPPPLHPGAAVSIDSGPHAGLCGFVHDRPCVIHAAGREEWVMIRLQGGGWVQVQRRHVSLAKHE